MTLFFKNVLWSFWKKKKMVHNTLNPRHRACWETVYGSLYLFIAIEFAFYGDYKRFLWTIFYRTRRWSSSITITMCNAFPLRAFQIAYDGGEKKEGFGPRIVRYIFMICNSVSRPRTMSAAEHIYVFHPGYAITRGLRTSIPEKEPRVRAFIILYSLFVVCVDKI